MKQNNTTKKLALAGVLTALAIVGSFISVPVAGANALRYSIWSTFLPP